MVSPVSGTARSDAEYEMTFRSMFSVIHGSPMGPFQVRIFFWLQRSCKFGGKSLSLFERLQACTGQKAFAEECRIWG